MVLMEELVMGRRLFTEVDVTLWAPPVLPAGACVQQTSSPVLRFESAAAAPRSAGA